MSAELYIRYKLANNNFGYTTCKTGRLLSSENITSLMILLTSSTTKVVWNKKINTAVYGSINLSQLIQFHKIKLVLETNAHPLSCAIGIVYHCIIDINLHFNVLSDYHIKMFAYVLFTFWTPTNLISTDRVKVMDRLGMQLGGRFSHKDLQA